MRQKPVLAVLALLCAGGLAAGARATAGGPLGASIAAGWRAFREPALLDRKVETVEAAVDCRRFDGDGAKALAQSSDLDAQIAHDFDRPRDEDLDDPESGGVRTLSMPELPVPLTRRTLRYVRFFTRTEAGRAAFQARFRRSGLYRDHVEFALREAGLPEDLVWLAAIESGFDPRALSPSGATGLFQFMPETGALYGLDQTEWVDERRSLSRATTAAVGHLRDLYERFHRWDFALAAYNAGFDRVVKAIDKTAASGHRAGSFSELAAARALSEETVNYVPQIHAFAIVAANRARFGLDDHGEGQAPDLGELAVPAGTRLRTIARAAGIPTSALRDLNPQLLRDRVPPTGGDYLVTLPAERVQHALATFPVYLDQEVVGQAEVEDVAPSIDTPSSLPSFGDEPLPSRPHQLGRNRLPEIASLGGGNASGGMLANLSVFDAKLPMVVVGAASGWQRPGSDPLGVVAAANSMAQAKSYGAVDPALEKELGFLREPSKIDALPGITLAPGVIARIRRDPSAALTAISVRISSNDGARAGGPATSDTSSTMTVAPKDVDAAVELAAARVRLEYGSALDAELSAMRRRAAEPRRKALSEAPYGRSWLALGDALFPADHALAGTVIGARSDLFSARDTLLVDAVGDEHSRAKASITIVGDVDEDRAKQLLTAYLGGFSSKTGSKAEPMQPHPRDERVSVEDDVPAPRLLYGFVFPGENEAGDASARILAELLDNPRVGRLAKKLGVGDGAVTAATAQVDAGPRASVFAVDVAITLGHEEEAEKKVDAELDALAEDGPTGAEVGAAKVYLKLKLEKERKLESGSRSPAGTPHGASLPELRHALRPDSTARLLRALDDVTPKTVQAVAKKYLAKDHRVLVITEPSTHGAALREPSRETASAEPHKKREAGAAAAESAPKNARFVRAPLH